ncbi:hypothetical protein A5888_003635 [Enterococcus sp. 9E7_DIV0242]|uniref:Gfo/Idh/MocA family oxidoreductase n=2 Tax=Candidatus Enterococcus clewellii TaxID=1834193 RepID=A0A242JYU9_9ENTE|nr:hypothetical protein A5888_004069 [Enterococcus sp. 9E7_DIV0242]
MPHINTEIGGTMKKIGLIGCGHIAHTHVTAYQQAGCMLVACCDENEEKGRQFAEKYGLAFYGEYQTLLKNKQIDVVSICTPHYLHKEMTVAALEAEKHVLCEKPLALTSEEGTAVLEAVDRSKKVYGVCYQNRFNDSSLALKGLLSEQDFGELKGIKCWVTWHREKEYYLDSSWRGNKAKEGGGVLINQAIHTFDLITWLTEMPEKIKGKVMTTLLEGYIEVEDTAMATALLPTGVPVSIYATNSYSSDPTPELYFDFEKAQIKLTMDELIINGEPIIDRAATSCEVGKSYWGKGHLRLISTFLEKIDGQQNERTDCLAAADGLTSLKMVEGIYRSDEKNDWINL